MAISTYVRDLRELVGDRLLLLPSVAVFVRDDAGRVLLVRHSDTGQWGAVGGGIDPGESPAAAARRETWEETGVRIRLGALLGAAGGSSYEVRYPNGDRSAYVVVAYEATIEEGIPEPDGEETTEVGWFSRDELATADLNGLVRALLEDVGLGG